MDTLNLKASFHSNKVLKQALEILVQGSEKILDLDIYKYMSQLQKVIFQVMDMVHVA